MNAKENIREQLSAYLDGELDAAQVKLVEQTLANDAELAEELEALRATRELLWSAPKAKAPEGFADRVLAEAQRRAPHAAQADASSGRGRWLRIAGVAAMLVVAMGLGVMVSQTFLTPTTPTAEPGTQIASREEVEPGEALSTEGKENDRYEASEISRGKRASGLADAPAVPERPAEAVGVGKGGAIVEAPDSRMRRDALGYDYLSNVEAARTEALARLDEINGRAMEIYVDDLPANQVVVEQVMVANGIALAPDEQTVLAPNQAVNLMDNRNFSHVQQAPPAPDVEEVQYLIYGQREQLAQLAGALESKVVRPQNVSQLPEPLYRRALELPGEKPEAIQPVVTKGHAGQPVDNAAKSPSEPAGPNPAMAKKSASQITAIEADESAPSSSPTPVAPAPRPVLQQPQSEAEIAAGPEAETPLPTACPEPDFVDGLADKESQLRRQPQDSRGSSEYARDAMNGWPRGDSTLQRGYIIRGTAAGQDDADMMIVTLRRREPPSRLNTQQQQNLDALESQLRQPQPLPQDRQSTLQAAPAQSEPATQPETPATQGN
jgi:hypothetical protein